jgi:hypothetical protein
MGEQMDPRSTSTAVQDASGRWREGESYAEMLGDLEIALTRQLNLACRGDVEQAERLAAKVEHLLARARRLAPARAPAGTAQPSSSPAACSDRLRRIGTLHRKLRTTLEARRHRARPKARRLRRDRTGLPADSGV